MSPRLIIKSGVSPAQSDNKFYSNSANVDMTFSMFSITSACQCCKNDAH